MWYEVWVEVHLFVYGYPIDPTQAVEKTVLSPPNFQWQFSQKSTAHTCVDLFFNSVPLHWYIFSIFISMPDSFD